MIERYNKENYDDGYYYGWEQGNRAGIIEGFAAAEKEYEQLLGKYMAELQMLNARISYLEHIAGDDHE